MCLDVYCLAVAEGRTYADVGDGWMGEAVGARLPGRCQQRLGCIDTAGRQQLVGCPQVRRGKSNLAPAPVAGDNEAVDEVMMAEQRRRLVDTALGDQAPHARARDHEVLIADGIDLLGTKV